MTIYVVTLKTTAQHDAEKRADLNSFLKTMKRTFGLRCIAIEEKEQEIARAKPQEANPGTRKAAENEANYN